MNMKIPSAEDGRASRTFIGLNALLSILLGMPLSTAAWAQTPIPQRQGWEANMLRLGANFCDQAAKLKSPVAQQAWTNAHQIRAEAEQRKR